MSLEFQYGCIMVMAVFISSVSQILLKKSALKKYDSPLQEYLNPFVITGYGLFFGCTLINIVALRYVPLSMSPILESSAYVFVSILGYIFLKEKISKQKALGMCLIFLGIMIFSL